MLDTADPASRAAFLKSHAGLVEGVVALARRVQVRRPPGRRPGGGGWCTQEEPGLAPAILPSRPRPPIHHPPWPALLQADKGLTNLIRRKFAIKCTTGYSLNALVRPREGRARGGRAAATRVLLAALCMRVRDACTPSL